MVTTNYHTHTTRCGHATGTDEEYVIAAIAAGYTVLGFSDHAFLPNYNRSVTMRGDYSELIPYQQSVAALKKKYASQIDVLTAMEAEYFPRFHDYYSQLLTSHQMDYLILAIHYIEFDDTINRMAFYAGTITQPQDALRYAEMALLGMNSGLFTYVAHPDLFLASYPRFDEGAAQAARLIATRAKELQMPLEFNQGGMRSRGLITIGDEVRYRYPVRQFWEIVREIGAPVILGVDAHSPADFAHPARQESERLIDEWGLRSLVVTDLFCKE